MQVKRVLKLAKKLKLKNVISRVAVVHLNFRAGSAFPVPDCTVSPGHWVNKADTR